MTKIRELVLFIFVEVLKSVLVNGVHHEQHLIALAYQCLGQRRVLDNFEALSGKVVNLVLLFLHARHIVIERGILLSLGGHES